MRNPSVGTSRKVAGSAVEHAFVGGSDGCDGRDSTQTAAVASRRLLAKDLSNNGAGQSGCEGSAAGDVQSMPAFGVRAHRGPTERGGGSSGEEMQKKSVSSEARAPAAGSSDKKGRGGFRRPAFLSPLPRGCLFPLAFAFRGGPLVAGDFDGGFSGVDPLRMIGPLHAGKTRTYASTCAQIRKSASRRWKLRARGRGYPALRPRPPGYPAQEVAPDPPRTLSLPPFLS